MKKYLLLATTAMLFAGNAMAASVATDGQSAEITISAELIPAKTIQSATDMSFGKLIISNEFTTSELTKVATLTNSTVTINDTNKVIAKQGSPASSTIVVSGINTVGDDANFDVTCGEYNANEYHNACSLSGSDGADLFVKDFSFVEVDRDDGNGVVTYRLDANLYESGDMSDSYSTNYSSSAPYTGTIIVTLNYE